jgi:hypothetical protein
MRRTTGQIVRLIGLALEVAGILAQALRTRTDQTGAPLSGHFPVLYVWIVVGVGFVLWMIGTTLIYWPRNRTRRQSSARKLGDLNL